MLRRSSSPPPPRCSGTSHIPPCLSFPPLGAGARPRTPPDPAESPARLFRQAAGAGGSCSLPGQPPPKRGPKFKQATYELTTGGGVGGGNANTTGTTGHGRQRVASTTCAGAGREGKSPWHHLGPNGYNRGTRAPCVRPRPEATCVVPSRPPPVHPWDAAGGSRAPRSSGRHPLRPGRPCASGARPPSLPSPVRSFVGRVIINLLTSCAMH